MTIEPVIIGRATHIYALADEAARDRYVGKTVRALHKRLVQHRIEARRRDLPVNRWVRKHKVSIRLLETVEAGGDWASRERHWITELGADGSLLNLTAGACLPRLKSTVVWIGQHREGMMGRRRKKPSIAGMIRKAFTLIGILAVAYVAGVFVHEGIKVREIMKHRET